MRYAHFISEKRMNLGGMGYLEWVINRVEDGQPFLKDARRELSVRQGADPGIVITWRIDDAPSFTELSRGE